MSEKTEGSTRSNRKKKPPVKYVYLDKYLRFQKEIVTDLHKVEQGVKKNYIAIGDIEDTAKGYKKLVIAMGIVNAVLIAYVLVTS